MKTHRFELVKWLPQESESIEIDWPKVHNAIGIDQTNWFLEQPKDACQLMLEQCNAYCSLVAEIYDEKTLVSYHLMWAK